MEYMALLFNEKDGDENLSKECILKYCCITGKKRAFPSGVARGHACHAEHDLNFFKPKIFLPNIFQMLLLAMPCSIGAQLQRNQRNL